MLLVLSPLDVERICEVNKPSCFHRLFRGCSRAPACEKEIFNVDNLSIPTDIPPSVLERRRVGILKKKFLTI